MGTIATLDVSRRELSELPWGYHRKANELDTSTGYKNLVGVWPHSQTMTLQPINTTSGFPRSGNWEALKFRLSDTQHDPDWWDERPGVMGDDRTPIDYYFRMKVKDTNLPQAYLGGGFSLLALLLYVATLAILAAIAFQEQNSTPSLVSTSSYPANQGYLLKFYLEGRPEFSDSDLLSFYFGDYAVRLDGTGIAGLYQATDATYSAYGLVYTFLWARESQIHDRFHWLLIYPHARNKIEFLSRTSLSTNFFSAMAAGIFHGENRGVNGGGMYEVPGELVKDDAGNFIVTQAGPWGLRVSKRFRPHIQISRLGFYTGSDGNATFFDAPADIGFAPTLPIFGGVDYDANGGQLNHALLDPDNGGAPFQVNGTSQRPQFQAQFIGEGDIICKGGLASTASPEFYSYSLDKPAGFTAYNRTSHSFPVLSVRIDQGDAPDGERLTIVIDNSQHRTYGDAEQYARRPDIPLTLTDDETGVTLFEGTAVSVVSGESPATGARTLTIEAIGMADNLLRSEWFALFNFTTDPNPEAKGQPWYWNRAVRRAFQAAGFDDSRQLVIEEEEFYKFRLWAGGGSGSGGARGGSGVSDAHGPPDIKGQWTPTPLNPVYEWIDFVLRDTLGWHWVWDRKNHEWRVYKRPDPRVATDKTKFTPKAVFYSNPDAFFADKTGLPAYRHQHFQTNTQRPVCSTVMTLSILPESQALTKAQLQGILGGIQSAKNTPDDPAISTQARMLPCYASNPHATDPLGTHPDSLSGKLRIKVIPCLQVANREAQEWITRRFYDDLTHGYVFGEFKADWGDESTAYLRKWDVIQIDSGRDPKTNRPNYTLEKWLIDRIEPEWNRDGVRQARYRVSLYREDAPPPR